MPKYLKNKRRRRHHIFDFKKTETVEMTSSDETVQKAKKPQKKSSFRILMGKKQAKKVRRIVVLCVAVCIALTVLLISMLSPTGIIEMYQNYVSTFSLSSKLPVELNGAEIFDVASKNRYFYLLSDTNISAISNNGKISYTDNHGFSSPVLCESEARCLVYDQNGKGVRIYNANKLLISMQMNNIIYSADISRNGTFAVAGKSDKYTSMVSVFNKKGELIYEWYCPEEIINAVAVAPNGKSVAVATVSVNGGQFDSSLYVLKFDSADAVFSKKYTGDYIYGINSLSKNNFVVICKNKCDIIKWNNYSVLSYSTDYTVNNVKSNGKYFVIASALENNQNEYSFNVFNKKKLSFSFEFSKQVDDFKIKGNNIFILSGNSVYLVNSDGKLVKSCDVGFGIVKIVPLSTSSCLAISHNSITKFNLQSEK